MHNPHGHGYNRSFTLEKQKTTVDRIYPWRSNKVQEANPNPFLAREEDFDQSAKKAGIPYRN
jgi:hypothetical protein